MQYFTVTDTDF